MYGGRKLDANCPRTRIGNIYYNNAHKHKITREMYDGRKMQFNKNLTVTRESYYVFASHLTAIGSITRYNRISSFQTLSTKCECSVKCDVNRN